MKKKPQNIWNLVVLKRFMRLPHVNLEVQRLAQAHSVDHQSNANNIFFRGLNINDSRLAIGDKQSYLKIFHLFSSGAIKSIFLSREYFSYKQEMSMYRQHLKV
uniref:Uncharacterized protein n=1 Tax=Glossina austeni TaxID=7395 RepID=A0A1A9UD67_GLOAU